MDFTLEEKELLVATVTESCDELKKLDSYTCVRVRNKDFPDHPDEAVAHEYIKALESLNEKEYVFQKSERVYNLTVSGKEKAKELAKEG